MRKIDFISKIILSNKNYLNYPFKLNFAITYRCNYKCKICNIWKKKKGNELSIKEIKNIFVKSNFFSWICLTGGEPFLRDDIIEIANIIKKNCKKLYILNIPTNGSFPDKIYETSKKILDKSKIPFHITTVSLDGPEKLHNELRNDKNAWKNAIETYKKLKNLSNTKKNFKVFFSFTLSPFNSNKFRETFDAAKTEIENLTIEDFHVNILNFSSHYYSNTNLSSLINKKTEDEMLLGIENILSLKNNWNILHSPTILLPYIYLNFSKKYLKTKKMPLTCKSLTSSIFLDAQGYVFPCVSLNENLGNLRNVDYDLKRILSSKKVADIKKRIKNLDCPNCWTPCESYQSIIGNLLESTSQAFATKIIKKKTSKDTK